MTSARACARLPASSGQPQRDDLRAVELDLFDRPRRGVAIRRLDLAGDAPETRELGGDEHFRLAGAAGVDAHVLRVALAAVAGNLPAQQPDRRRLSLGHP